MQTIYNYVHKYRQAQASPLGNFLCTIFGHDVMMFSRNCLGSSIYKRNRNARYLVFPVSNQRHKMSGYSKVLTSQVSCATSGPQVRGHAHPQSVKLQFKEPIDRLLGELERPAGPLSTVITAVGVRPGVTLKKEKLSRCAYCFIHFVLCTHPLSQPLYFL